MLPEGIHDESFKAGQAHLRALKPDPCGQTCVRRFWSAASPLCTLHASFALRRGVGAGAKSSVRSAMFIATDAADPPSSVGAACLGVWSDIARGIAERLVPLLRSLAGFLGAHSINMALLTELARSRSLKMRIRCSSPL